MGRKRFYARKGDPDTAKEAGESLTSAFILGATAFAFECVKESPGCTQKELDVKYSDIKGDTRRVGKRLIDCERAGLVRRGDTRRCSHSGRRAQTWWPIEKAK